MKMPKFRNIAIFQIFTEPEGKSADPDQIDRICQNNRIVAW
jgi:hypothetical protein